MRTAFVATTFTILAILGFGVFFLLFVENSIGKNGVILSIAFVGFSGVGIVILLILAATVIVLGRVFGDTVGAQSSAFAAFLKSFGQWASYMKETSKSQPKPVVETPTDDDEWTVYGSPMTQLGAPQQARLPGAHMQQHQLPVFPDELPSQQTRTAASEVMVR